MKASVPLLGVLLLAFASPSTAQVVQTGGPLGRARHSMTSERSAGSMGRSTGSITVAPDWSWKIQGSQIGSRGLAVADIDGDGRQEVVATGSSSQFGPSDVWTVSRLEGAEFEVRWGGPSYAQGIDGLVVAEADGSAGLEIVVTAGGWLYEYDGVSLRLEREYLTSLQHVSGLAVADLDEDGSLDVVLCGEQGTWAYSLSSGDEELALPGVACTDVAVGETDGTSGLEIVIANGADNGLVLDARTGAVEWTCGLGLGQTLAVADFDGDGVDEIAAAFPSVVQIWNGDTHTLLREGPGSQVIAGADVDGDAPAELLYPDGWDHVCIADGASGVTEWCSPWVPGGVSRIAVADVDGDGILEILWGAGGRSTEKDQLHAVDVQTHEADGASIDVRGPFHSLAHGDIDADGAPELFFCSTESDAGYGDAVYDVYDAESKDLEYHSEYSVGNGFTHTGRMQVGNTDADAPLEIVRVFPDPSTWHLQCIDGATNALEWETTGSFGSAASMQLGDADGDGEADIAFASGWYVYLYNGATGQLEWQSPSLSAYFDHSYGMDLMRIADVDDDGVGELIVGMSGFGLVALDPVTGAVDLELPDLEVTALEVADLDGDSIADIVVGTAGGEIERLDAISGEPNLLAGPFGAGIDGLAVVDLNRDRVDDYVFAVEGRVHIVDGVSGLDLWVGRFLGDGAGRRDTLVVDDIDEDWSPEIWVNVGAAGHVVYEVPSASLKLFTDGFESGDPSQWSVMEPAPL